MSCLFPLSHFADSNRRPTHYECVALPTELKWRRLRVLRFCEACVSGWEDSNFRPPRPERGALTNCATPRDSVLAGIRTLDPLIKSQLLYQLSYQDICSILACVSATCIGLLSCAGVFFDMDFAAAAAFQISLFLERKTRLELATPTLARSCSTNWAISA